MFPRTHWMLLIGLAACGEKDGDSAVDSTPIEEASFGMPEGESSWTGSVSLAESTFTADVTIQNSGGDLTGVVEFTDDFLAGSSYALVGTHAPASGRVALSPEDWVVISDPPIELVGFIGIYDPDASTLTGELVDYAGPSQNATNGGPVSLTLVEGAGEPTAVGDGGKAMAVGVTEFSGQHQCTGPVREAEASLDYDGEGWVEGTISYGDTTLEEATMTFEVTGVHNPSTGGLTLVPGVYTSSEIRFLTFFIDGDYDPSGSFEGTGYTNAGPCVSDGWAVSSP